VIGKEGDLHRGEALQMNARPNLLQAAQQVGVVTERQAGMQAVDDVHFGNRFAAALAELVEDLLHRHRVRAGHPFLQARERAEQARSLTHVRRLEAQVVIEVSARAVAPLALLIRDPPECKQILRLEQPDAVFKRQTLPRLDLAGDVRQPGSC
jgi:hypothetical protein